MPQTIPKMPQVNIFSCKGKNMIHYMKYHKTSPKLFSYLYLGSARYLPILLIQKLNHVI